MDIQNICFVLRPHKEQKGPRGRRYHLKPGEPVRVVFEPWEIEVVCARSLYTGTSENVIQLWERRGNSPETALKVRKILIWRQSYPGLLSSYVPSV